MTGDQLAIFDQPQRARPALPPASGNTDPVTSYRAEERITKSGKRQTQADLVHDFLTRFPRHTSAELAHRIKPGCIKTRFMVARRLPDLLHLERAAQVGRRLCQQTGEECVVWESL